MMQAGAQNLNRHVENVNALNVFPVPDGDTGTNMNLTLSSGVREMEKHASAGTVGKLAEALSKGLLMGARGNSGVILSQLFRGFAKAVANKESINAVQLADAFQRGVETAYKAVIKPVEGTILTVAREAAEAGMRRSWYAENPADILDMILTEARQSLARTPDLLPVLKQAGVVDAGGQGLIYVYEGMLQALRGEINVEEFTELHQNRESLAEVAHEHNAQSKIDPSQIEYGYCTEFIIQLKTDRRKTEVFEEQAFRQAMTQFGDSLLVVADDELVKVHIHAEYPGNALNYAMKFGDLTGIKIDNMREQYANVTEGKAHHQPTLVEPTVEEPEEKKPYGFVAVAAGEGLANIFRSMGVDVVIEGGQTMNPSTEDLVKAVEQIAAEHIFILPNNKNIILTAEQVSKVVDQEVSVIPTRTIPQGLAALLAFDASQNPAENKQNMIERYQEVRSGELTYAVRNSKMNGIEIQAGDFLGIHEGKIEVVGKDMLDTACELLKRMKADEADIVTVIYGQDVEEAQLTDLQKRLENDFPDAELEWHDGGQPLYYFLFSVE
nr:DAK2 domain-containing protein [Thermoflavimicrobium dichotomicum]